METEILTWSYCHLVDFIYLNTAMFVVFDNISVRAGQSTT